MLHYYGKHKEQSPQRKPIRNRKRYEVVDAGTGERFGNHTYTEAVARVQIMRRNWNYRKVFTVQLKKEETA